MNLFHNQLQNKGRCVKGMMEHHLPSAPEPFDKDGPDGGHIHQGTRRDISVAGLDRDRLEAQIGLKQPVVVGHRTALRLSLRSGRPAKGKNIVGVYPDGVGFPRDGAFRHLLNIGER